MTNSKSYGNEFEPLVRRLVAALSQVATPLVGCRQISVARGEFPRPDRVPGKIFGGFLWFKIGLVRETPRPHRQKQRTAAKDLEDRASKLFDAFAARA